MYRAAFEVPVPRSSVKSRRRRGNYRSAADRRRDDRASARIPRGPTTEMKNDRPPGTIIGLRPTVAINWIFFSRPDIVRDTGSVLFNFPGGRRVNLNKKIRRDRNESPEERTENRESRRRSGDLAATDSESFMREPRLRCATNDPKERDKETLTHSSRPVDSDSAVSREALRHNC